VPAFLDLQAQGLSASLAIGLGGVLFAQRAFLGLAGGAAALSRAAIVWEQVAPLFRAASAPEAPTPYVPGVGPRGQPGARLLDASGLTFRYRTTGAAVLSGLDLHLKHGDRLLLEGPSGGGKSTLASLLVGLRQPESGLLLLQGLDRHTLGDNWHRMATEAPQFHENHILQGSLAFNLLMGRRWPATTADLDEARQLCEELGLGGVIARMPAGMQQIVGETGWQLSHGERSRIFLARALLQKAPLTVLDESFAALDPETLQRCLRAAFRHADALVVIAHP
jgi:ATP-binding cassette, subfamily B, bacterial